MRERTKNLGAKVMPVSEYKRHMPNLMRENPKYTIVHVQEFHYQDQGIKCSLCFIIFHLGGEYKSEKYQWQYFAKFNIKKMLILSYLSHLFSHLVLLIVDSLITT